MEPNGHSCLNLNQILAKLHDSKLQEKTVKAEQRLVVFNYLGYSEPLVTHVARRIIMQGIFVDVDDRCDEQILDAWSPGETPPRSPWLEHGFEWALVSGKASLAEWVELLVVCMKRERGGKSHPERLSGVDAISGGIDAIPRAKSVATECVAHALPHFAALWQIVLSGEVRSIGTEQTDRLALALLALTGSCTKLLCTKDCCISLHHTSTISVNRAAEEESEGSSCEDEEDEPVCMHLPPLVLFFEKQSKFSAEVRLKAMDLLLVLLKRTECLAESSLGPVVLGLLGSEILDAVEVVAPQMPLSSIAPAKRGHPSLLLSSSSSSSSLSSSLVSSTVVTVCSFVDAAALSLEKARTAVILWAKALHCTVLAAIDGDVNYESDADEGAVLEGSLFSPKSALDVFSQLGMCRNDGKLAHIVVELVSDDDQALVQTLCDLAAVHSVLRKYFIPSCTLDCASAEAASFFDERLLVSRRLGFYLGGSKKVFSLLELF